jgi:hypothetical protein
VSPRDPIAGSILCSVMIDPGIIAVLYSPSSTFEEAQSTPADAKLYIGAVNTEIEPIAYKVNRPGNYTGLWMETLETVRGTLIVQRTMLVTFHEDLLQDGSMSTPELTMTYRWSPAQTDKSFEVASLPAAAFDYLPTESGNLTVMAVDRAPLYVGVTTDERHLVCVMGPEGVSDPFTAAELFVGDPTSGYATRRALSSIEPKMDSALWSDEDDRWFVLKDTEGSMFVSENVFAEKHAEPTDNDAYEAATFNEEALTRLAPGTIIGYDPYAGVVHFQPFARERKLESNND